MSGYRAEDPSTWSGPAWSWWMRGYERGAQSGYSDGYARAVEDLLGSMDWVVDAQPSRHPSHAELTRRRTDYPVKAKTAAQIQAEARHSWAKVEREIGAGA